MGYFKGFTRHEIKTIEEVRSLIVKMKTENAQLKQENKQLKEALLKASRYNYTCGFEHCLAECKFCGANGNDDCKDDCEYVRLIK